MSNITTPVYSISQNQRLESTASAYQTLEVTPSDTVNLADAPARELYIGVPGNVRITDIKGNVTNFLNHPVGYLPVHVMRVHATGTTASSIVALY